MEPQNITIGGQTVTLTWTQEVARRYAFRASKIGGGPSFADFLHKTKAASAVTTFLWLILPPAVNSRYATPEDLFLAIAEEDAAAIHAAIMEVIAAMNPPEEEKKNSGNLHSQESS